MSAFFSSRRILLLTAAVLGCIACCLLLLRLLLPAGASEEFKYTVEVCAKWTVPLLALISAACALTAWRDTAAVRWLQSVRGAACLGIAGLLICAVPILSPSAAAINWRYAITFSICWITGPFFLAFAIFFLAAKVKSMWSGVLCLAASLCLAFSAGETVYLMSPRAEDGHWTDVSGSKYVKTCKAAAHEEWRLDRAGRWPVRPSAHDGAMAHRQMYYDEELFDAKYTLNERNHRATPSCSGSPEADLLVFGCSFSFGHGLNDEETWPWLLAQDLGPSWCVENYAYMAFGAQQMLLLLEENKITPPKAPERKALFLAIHDHIRRNSGLYFMEAPRYELQDNGSLKRGASTANAPVSIFYKLPAFFNGSQFMRKACKQILDKLIVMAEPELIKPYVAMLIESARLLREKYGADLTVILWPDIENIAPELQRAGISVLYARRMLKDWERLGETAYQIVPGREIHPNGKATHELAQALAHYYRNKYGQ